MNAFKGLVSFLAICLVIALGYCVSLPGKPPPGHGHGKPSPTPSPTVTPAPSPSPSSTPIPGVTLAWDAVPVTGNPDTDAAGYYLRFGFAPGAENTPVDVGNVTVWTLPIQSATTYYFVVTAYNTARVESPPSNEVSYSSP